MLPTRLNLLSPRKQMAQEHMVYAQYTKYVLEITLFVSILCSITLLGGRWLLEYHFNAVVASLTSVSQEQSQKNHDIVAVNDTLRQVAAIQRTYLKWTELVRTFAETTPSGVFLNALTMNHKDSTYIITGVASSRTDLLNYQKQLEAVPTVESVSLPLSSLTEKADVPFSMTVVLKKSL